MLTALELELLTAAVDGDLSPSRAVAFSQLLKAKSEATNLFRALESDAGKLRAAIPGPIPASQVSAILARIQPLARPRRAVPARRSIFLQYATAAAVFFTGCSATFWYFTAQDRTERDKVQKQRLPHVDPANPDPERVSLAIAPTVPKILLPKSSELPEELPIPIEVIARLETELAPAPRSAFGDVVGSGIIENPKPLAEIRLRLPFLAEAIDFNAFDVQTQLAKEFGLDPAFRLDLFSKNPAGALEMLQTLAKQAGVTVTVDAKTQELWNKKVPMSIAFYFEGLTPAELTEFLGSVGKQLQTNPKSPAIGMAHLLPLGATDLRDLKETLGVDLAPTRAKSATVGEPKPISADTLAKVTGAVKKTGDKSGIVVAFLPPNLRTALAQSKEIKTFLEKRGERKSGTTPLLMILRSQG